MGYDTTMNLVFAHFNTPLPRHLVLNLKRSAALFPLSRIFLLTDIDLKIKNFGNIEVIKYSPKNNWYLLNNLLKHPKEFRGNFWFTSIARFLALADFSNQLSQEILHIESDVILAEDFPFNKLSKAGFDFLYPLVSDTTAIASCLYIRNSLAAELLADFTINQVQKNNVTTDMYILSELTRSESVSFAPLPTAPSRCYADPQMINGFLKKSDLMLEEFSGVFDGGDIGRYLFGDDARNKRGVSVLRDNDAHTHLNVRDLNLVVKSEREFPYIHDIASDSFVPVYSLHIHSKHPGFFDAKKSIKIIHKHVAVSEKNPQRIIILSVLLQSILKSLKRRIIYRMSRI
jgi:hypothetical protein